MVNSKWPFASLRERATTSLFTIYDLLFTPIQASKFHENGSKSSPVFQKQLRLRMKVRRFVSALVLALFSLQTLQFTARADEGMWPFNNLPRAEIKRKYGF